MASSKSESSGSSAKRWLRRLFDDQAGAAIVEWTLLLVALALPFYYIVRLLLATLLGHYQMMALFNSLPFP